MQIKEYNLNSYKLHILKSDKVKSVHLEVHFRSKVDKKNIHLKNMLSDILTDCSRDYRSRKEVVIKLEELYKSSFYGTTSKIGDVFDNIFVYDFINPAYIKETTYLEDVLSLPFDMIFKPKAKNHEFESTIFDVIKNRAIRDIQSIHENPIKLSISNSLKAMDPESLTSVSVLGTYEDVESSTAKGLYDAYEDMVKNSYCDIFIIGDVEYDDIYQIITQKMNLNTIKTGKLDMDVYNKLSSKVKKKEDTSTFVQTNLALVYNLDQMSDLEKHITIQVYNYILGSGGLNSKLYQKLREENSLCYGVYSIYLKYDNLLLLQVSLDDANKKMAIKLMKSCLKEMEKGMFSDEQLEDAKNNLLVSLKMSKDNNISLLSNYIFGKYANLPDIDTRISHIKKITKEDIINLAKKVKINTEYTLKSGGNN